MFLKVKDYVNIHLHRGYILPAMKKHLKLAQQFVRPFKVIQRVS